MRISIIGCLAGSALLLAGAAHAADTAAAQTETTNGNQIVCRHLPPPTGTRIGGRRVCKTAREWDQLRADNQKTTREIQAKGILSKHSGN